jgi:hypothetical protein
MFAYRRLYNWFSCGWLFGFGRNWHGFIFLKTQAFDLEWVNVKPTPKGENNRIRYPPAIHQNSVPALVNKVDLISLFFDDGFKARNVPISQNEIVIF